LEDVVIASPTETSSKTVSIERQQQ